MKFPLFSLLLLRFLDTSSSAAGDTDTVGGRQVKVFTEALPWHAAQRVCRDHGMALLGLHNAEQEKEALQLANRDILPGFWVGNTIQQRVREKDEQKGEDQLHSQAFGETFLVPHNCDLADTEAGSGISVIKSRCSRKFPFMCEGEAVQERCEGPCKSEEEENRQIVDEAIRLCNESRWQVIETQRTVCVEKILGLEKSLARGQLEMNQLNEDLEAKGRELDRMTRLKEWLMILIGIVSCLLLVTIVVASVVCGAWGRRGANDEKIMSR